LLLATVLDPRIKDKLFSTEERGKVRMLLITELENLSIARNDVASVSESLEPPVKIAKMSIGSSRIQQLLESAQQVSRIDETAASKILMVNYLKFD